MNERGIEYKIYPVEDGGVMLIVNIHNSAFPGAVFYYKTTKEAVKEFTKHSTTCISEICRATGEGEDFDQWRFDFQKKLEWICKD